jgi:DNA-binding GntR family transcriptional regulator
LLTFDKSALSLSIQNLGKAHFFLFLDQITEELRVAHDDIIRGMREQIASRLRDDVLSGRLTEGQHLFEAHLAERFGVSRGPIREALVQLTHEGLVVAKPNCGVTVASSAPDSIRQIVIPIRRTIETFALRLIFPTLTVEDFRAWDRILDRMKRACQERDLAAAVEQDIAFHRLLLERAGQPDLLAIWATIVARIRGHFHQVHLDRGNNPIDVHADHRVLVEALRKGDEEAAVKALQEHIE